jgi:HPt (histidine-containing phosphotransfer) domain-containing protein
MPANFTVALERLGNDVALFREFIGFYCDDCPGFLVALRAAVRNHDCGGAQRAAHALKGLVASLGAEAAASLAATIERYAHDGDLSKMPGLLESLDREIGLLDDELREAETRRQFHSHVQRVT